MMVTVRVVDAAVLVAAVEDELLRTAADGRASQLTMSGRILTTSSLRKNGLSG